MWALAHPLLALLAVVALVAVPVVGIVSTRGAGPEAAVERYVEAGGLDRDVTVDCAKTDTREDGRAVYSCSIESDGVELADGSLLAECYVVDGKNAYPSRSRC